jgi:hypothetical protein
LHNENKDEAVDLIDQIIRTDFPPSIISAWNNVPRAGAIAAIDKGTYSKVDKNTNAVTNFYGHVIQCPNGELRGLAYRQPGNNLIFRALALHEFPNQPTGNSTRNFDYFLRDQGSPPNGWTMIKHQSRGILRKDLLEN